MANIKTLRDIILNPNTRLSPSQMRETYGVSGTYHDDNNVVVARNIDKVTINGNVFTDYSAFSFLWEKSYVSSPTRSGNGSIGNLNSFATFLTPHLKIDFGLMSIDSYRKIMQLIYTSNEFLVTCYDVVNNKDTTNKMYFSTEEMPKLWTIVDALNGDENAVMLLGVQDYTVEMIGTNNDIDTVTVNYYLNSPTGSGTTTPIQSVDVYIGGEIVLGSGLSMKSYETEFDGYLFKDSWRLGSSNGTLYPDGRAFDITKAVIDEDSNSINFYAEWIPTNTYTLTYSYGIGEPARDTDGKEIISKTVKKGEDIGDLPRSTTPTVEYNGTTYTPYEYRGWYKSAERAIDLEEIVSTTPYWADQSVIIYQHFEPTSAKVSYYLDGALYIDMFVKYGTDIPIVKPSGYAPKIFKGWSLQEGGAVISSMTMPPVAINLYAVFEVS